MSDKKGKIRKMPSFTKTCVRTWISDRLAEEMPPAEAAVQFLKVFAEYDKAEYGDYEKRLDIVTKRFREYNRHPKLSIYHEIKKKRKLAKEDIYQIAELSDPLERLVWLNSMLKSPDADYTVAEEIKILAEIGKLADRLTGADVKQVESDWGGANYTPSKYDWLQTKKEAEQS
ncbi:MAG: hypothetical protein OXI43_13930 [Candidatus Poribacteria bacterium]|nr:hypothetical protein [Candidatus Poribacteria bacterium]